jgi:hypothetical protein
VPLARIEQRLGRSDEARRFYDEAEERIRQPGEARKPNMLLAQQEATDLLGLP